MPSIEEYTLCRFPTGEQREDPEQLIEERVRFAEVLYFHAEAGCVNPSMVGRMLTFILF